MGDLSRVSGIINRLSFSMIFVMYKCYGDIPEFVTLFHRKSANMLLNKMIRYNKLCKKDTEGTQLIEWSYYTNIRKEL